MKTPTFSLVLPSPGAPTKIPVSAFLAAVVLFSLPSVRAVDGTWKAGTGSGVWSATSNWTGDPNPVPGGAGSEVGLNTGTGGSVFVTIDGAVASRTVGTLDFGGSSIWSLAASGGGTLTFDNSGLGAAEINIENVGAISSAHVITAPVILTSSVIVNANDPNRGLSTGLGAVISGAGSITKNGPGGLGFYFSAVNTFAGGFTLNGGKVGGSNNSSFGSGTLTLNGGTVGNTGGTKSYGNTLVLGGDVTFGGAGGGANAFTGTTTLTGTRILTADSAVELSGNIGDGSSGYGITKNGTGTMTLGRNGVGGANTFSGDFTLNAGGIILAGSNGVNTQFGSGVLIVNGGSIGASIFTRTVANDVTWNADANIASTGRVDYSGVGTLTGNRILTNDGTTVYKGNVGESGGSWSLTKAGAGIFWFETGSNSFTGGFKITAGSVNVGGTNNFGGGPVTVDGGVMNLATHSSTVGAVTINGGTLSNSGGSGLLSSSSGFTLTGGAINAILAGSGGLVKSGTGTATFGAATGGANTYSGGTIVNAGSLALGANNRLPTAGALTVNGGSFAMGAFNQTVTAVTVAGGAITSTSGTMTATSYAMQSGSASAIFGGAATLAKTTTGTATLSGVNTYSGTTTVSAGTLIISGTGSVNSSSGVTINGGTLAYNSSTNLSSGVTFASGKIAGTNWAGSLSGLSIGSGQAISPGNSPGTAATGDQTWAGSGSYVWEINNATGTAGTDPGWDLLTGTGALTLTATSGNKFNINVTSLTLGNVAGDATNFSSVSSYEWMIADFSSAITTFDASAFNIDPSAFSNAATGAFSIARGDSISGGDNTELYLVYTAIPEPSTLALLGMSLTVVVAFRRRRSAC